MGLSMFDLSFYRDKRVFITGHTGFKGSWLCTMLDLFGAKVFGYSFNSPKASPLFKLLKLSDNVFSCAGDVRDLNLLKSVMSEFKPEIVIHLAAQPLVRESYNDPVGTYSTNVMGTVNICEAVRLTDSVKSFLNVTTDKVYKNYEKLDGYTEDEQLDGFDPYSNSKSCSELITHSFKSSFFSGRLSVSTARAGNVIGGGDFSKDRIIPDCVRAAVSGEKIHIRNPNSVRPYQHVLEPLYAYLMIAGMQYKDEKYEGYYNIGPNYEDCSKTSELVNLFIKYWGDNLSQITQNDNGPHEANYLKLDCTKLKNTFNWEPRWNLDTAVKNTVCWYKAWASGVDAFSVMKDQIRDYLDM